MPKRWEKPTYEVQSPTGQTILIDVTTSVSPGSPPNSVLINDLVPFLQKRKVHSVVDFGAGALRHTLALLDAGFEVCAVEFEEGFAKPACRKALDQARRHANFSALVWPKEFIKDKRKFDAALLMYVLQIMPVPKERDEVIKYLFRKLRADTHDSYLFYTSRYGQLEDADYAHAVSDGYYRWPGRRSHSFYREFTTELTHQMITHHGFRRIRSLSKRGTDQMFVYIKGKGEWI